MWGGVCQSLLKCQPEAPGAGVASVVHYGANSTQGPGSQTQLM